MSEQLRQNVVPAAEMVRAMLVEQDMLCAIVIGHKADSLALCYNKLPEFSLTDVEQMLLEVLHVVQRQKAAPTN